MSDTPLLRVTPMRQYGSGRPLVVVAIGGNALMHPGDDGSLATQYKRAEQVARVIQGIARRGYRILLVHGNGPQVGQELIRSEEASTKLPLVPLDACVASTQGTMGYQLELALYNASHTLRVATVLTLVEVKGDHMAGDKVVEDKRLAAEVLATASNMRYAFLRSSLADARRAELVLDPDALALADAAIRDGPTAGLFD